MTVVVSSKLVHSQYFSVPGKEILIKGTNEPYRGKIEGIIRSDTVNFTTISKADWEAILKYHGNSDAILKGFVQVAKNPNEAKAKGNDQKNMPTGFDPVDPVKNAASKPAKEK